MKAIEALGSTGALSAPRALGAQGHIATQMDGRMAGWLDGWIDGRTF